MANVWDLARQREDFPNGAEHNATRGNGGRDRPNRAIAGEQAGGISPQPLSERCVNLPSGKRADQAESPVYLLVAGFSGVRIRLKPAEMADYSAIT
jgi:hypothetical protein